ncbi:MAG: HlyD family efflux transporter periplasmic adaptor subunit [Nostocaceae cyanobacterium]|nr:HlyD family efflux transporter periplasmic adaptor subunit [Nostocaceae cyanobacterium]
MTQLNGNHISQNGNGVKGKPQLMTPKPKPKEVDKSFEQSVILRQSPVWSRAIMLTLIGVATFGITWAYFAKIEQVVPAAGQLKPEGAVKEVQAPVSGVVKEVFVEDGNRVKSGDLLLIFDNVATTAELKSLKKIRDSLMQENKIYSDVMTSSSALATELAFLRTNLPKEIAFLLRNRAALVSENELLRTQLKNSGVASEFGIDEQRLLAEAKQELDSRKAAARLEVEQLQKQLAQNTIRLQDAQSNLKIDSEILSRLEILNEEGAIAQLQFLRQQQQVENRKAEIAQLTEENKRLRLDIEQGREEFNNTVAASNKTVLEQIGNNKKRIAEIDSQLTKVVVDNKKRLAEINSRISQTELNFQYQELRAPTDGVIFDLQATPRFVANPTQELLKIVPNDDELIAEVFITNRDIGFVRENMKVDVRIDTFPFSEFGDIKGEIIWVGSDALPPDETHQFYRFPAKIRLDSQQLNVKGRRISLQSGMSVSANIKVREDRTVLSLITDLFTKQVESLKQVR